VKSPLSVNPAMSVHDKLYLQGTQYPNFYALSNGVIFMQDGTPWILLKVFHPRFALRAYSLLLAFYKGCGSASSFSLK
jgi:hypothetical protein